MTNLEKLTKLTTFAADGFLDQGVLDDLVHDLKSQEASNLNNSGQTGQLLYICGCLTSEEVVSELWDDKTE